MLSQLNIKRCYRTKKDDIPGTLLVPALSHGIQYDRGTGYFSIDALVELSAGIIPYIKNNGIIRIVTSVDLDMKEMEIIKNGLEYGRQKATDYILRQIEDSFASSNDILSLDLICNLIAANRIQIKIAFLPDGGIYHEKIGYIRDKDGESDITVIIESSEKKYGLLIEDKIDAIAMPQQPERYIKRGERGKKNKDYDEFYSFIVCPEKYYKNNKEAKDYRCKVMYEEIRKYFSEKTDPASAVYFQQISQAIEKAKRPPKVEINANANRFFRKYKDYQEENYPELNLTTKRDANGYWAHYTTRFGLVFLYHKISDGNVDLTFNRAAKHLDKLETIANWYRKYGIANVSAVKTGMAGALRVTVPKLNMDIPFEENDDYDIQVCFKTINDLIEAVNVFGIAESISALTKDYDKL